jgi:hypothetical protein
MYNGGYMLRTQTNTMAEYGQPNHIFKMLARDLQAVGGERVANT